jgi:hypothetical protein
MIKGQEIVVPITIRVSSHISSTPSRADDADIGTLSVVRVHDEEGIGLCVDARDYLISAPLPTDFWIAQLRNVLMRALRMWFGDASHLDVGHDYTFLAWNTEACLRTYAESQRRRRHRRQIFSRYGMSEASVPCRIRGRRGAPLNAEDVSVRSRDEIEAAIRALTDAQWIRLRKASAYFAWVHDFSADDLLQEAFCRALAGGRQCPIDIDIGV